MRGLLVVMLVSAVAAPSAATPGCDVDGFDDRCEAWVARYDHAPGHDNFGDDAAVAMGVDPRGRYVYVTSWSWEGATGYDIALQAVDVSTGAEAWVARHHAPAGRDDFPAGIAVGPDGDLVYVAGTEGITDEQSDMVVLAFDAASGALRWRTTLDQPGRGYAVAIAAAPGGREVFLVGTQSSASEDRIVTVALDTRNGAPLWQEVDQRPPRSRALARAIEVTDDRVFVAATEIREDGNDDYLVLAYELVGSARDARPMWEASFDGGQALADEVASIDVSREGDRVFVTGMVARPSTLANRRDRDYGTAAFDAATGALLWSASFGSGGDDYPYAVVAAPDRDRVYVSGGVSGVPRYAFGTLAYDGTTGEQIWATRSEFPWGQAAVALAVAPDGRRLYVTGHSATPSTFVGTAAGGVFAGRADYATVALDDAGTQVWAARYGSSATLPSFDLTAAIAVAPDGGRVFVTGTFGNTADPAYLEGAGNGWDAGTVAYEA